MTMELQECCRLFASPQRAVPPRALPQIRDVFVCVCEFLEVAAAILACYTNWGYRCVFSPICLFNLNLKAC